MNIISLTFIIYLFIIMGVGFITSRMMKNLKDFALGGNRLGPVVIAFSERASGESAWLILGLPGVAIAAGLLEAWTALGCVLGIIFSWLIIAKPIRMLTEKYDALTIPELLSKKFEDETGTIRLLSAIIITFFFTFYVAAQFSGAGKVLHVTFGFSHLEGMIVGAIIILSYTIMGGFLAVAWTDLVQGIIMIGTLVILPIVGWIELSGISPSAQVLDWSTLYGGQTGVSALLGAIAGLSWGLGYMGQPHLIVRYMAIDHADNIKVSRRIAIAWAIPAFMGSLLIGLVGAKLIAGGALHHNGEILSVMNLDDPEKLMPIMAANLLPPWLAGIFISGAIAAMMSTADSQLLVSTTVLTEDIVGRSKKGVLQKINLLRLGRILTGVIGTVAFYLAWQSTDLVFEMVSYAWSGLGASFGPALVLTLWWKHTSRNGVIAGLLVGSVSTIIWKNIDILHMAVTERLVSFVLAFSAVILFSLLDRFKEHDDRT